MTFIEKFRVGRFIRTIWVAYRDFRLQIFLITVLSFFNGLFEGVSIVAIIPLLSFVDHSATTGQDVVSRSIQTFFTTAGLDFSLRNMLIALTLLFIVKALLMYWNMSLGAKIGYRYDTSTRERLFRKTLSTKWPFISNQKIGHLEQILVTDVNYASTILSSLSATTIITVNLIIYGLIVVNLSTSVAVFTVIFGSGLFILIKPIMYRNKSVSDETARMIKKLAHVINESITGMKVVRSLSAEQPLSERVNTFFERVGVLKVRNLVFRNVSNIIVPPLGFIFVLLMFAYMYKTGQFTIATFAVVVYAINKVFSNVQLFQSQLHAMTSMLPHLNAVMFYEKELDKNKVVKHGAEEFILKDNISFERVTFSYPERPILLNELSFEIKKGSIVGIAGQSGSGKTTVVDLLLRLLEQDSGAITIDGTPISEVGIEAWRRAIGYVSQDPFLLNATIADNIRFFNKDITDEEVKQSAKNAGIDDFIEGLPKGYQTEVGERGVLLSGGQRQRIALARVLARKPQVLILDEATSALDNESESRILSALERLKGTVTIIMIAHRSSTLSIADKIINI